MANGENGNGNGTREFRLHRIADYGVNAAISAVLVVVIGYIMIIPTLRTEFDYMKRDLTDLRRDMREWKGQIAPQREQAIADITEIKTRLSAIEARLKMNNGGK